MRFVYVLAVLGAGCGETLPCDADDLLLQWPDNDEDGFGADTANPALVCPDEAGWALVTGDCNDDDVGIHPNALETCDQIDRNCDGNVDFPLPTRHWWPDADGDGFGAIVPPTSSCSMPDANHVDVPGDCDDTAADVHPNAMEVCNGGIDDDCDGLIDDADSSIDATTFLAWYPDADADGYGGMGAQAPTLFCDPSGVAGAWSANTDDCDDDNANVSPSAVEVCNGIDDNCDGRADDPTDPLLDASTLFTLYADDDQDGLGNPDVPFLSCRPQVAGYASTNDDCDDGDVRIADIVEWSNDGDGDGVGDGNVLTSSTDCVAPTSTAVKHVDGVDCDDGDPQRAPGLFDPCLDGVDQDCDGVDDACRSCGEWLAIEPTSADGVYVVQDRSGTEHDIFCDMTTDGGGWTLVGSTMSAPLVDAAGPATENLQTLEPGLARPNLWSGFAPDFGDVHDVRFSCKIDTLDADMAVDLAFYDVDWYASLVAGSDADSCFNTADQGGAPFPPERTNLLNAEMRAAGEAWTFDGLFVGEDACSSTDDFTVDFDDRGMDGASDVDGTDWGEEDGIAKCAATRDPAMGAWFLWVRE